MASLQVEPAVDKEQLRERQGPELLGCVAGLAFVCLPVLGWESSLGSLPGVAPSPSACVRVGVVPGVAPSLLWFRSRRLPPPARLLPWLWDVPSPLASGRGFTFWTALL